MDVFFCLNPGTFTPWRGGGSASWNTFLLSSNKGKKEGKHTLCWNNDRTWRWQKNQAAFWSSETAENLHWPWPHYFTRSKIFLFWHLKSTKISGTPQRCWFPLFLGSMILDSDIPNECKWYIKTYSPNVKSQNWHTHTHTRNAWHKLVQVCDQSQSYNSSEGRSLTNILCRTGIVGKLVALILPCGAKANPKPFLSVKMGDKITWHQKKIPWTNKHGVWNMSQNTTKKHVVYYYTLKLTLRALFMLYTLR